MFHTYLATLKIHNYDVNINHIAMQARYDSFIDLQDKLHQNICRKRSLVAIGTHDLSTIQGPFSYEALPGEDIKFTPLKQTKEFNAKDLLEFYKSDLKLRAFVPLIQSSPVYPVIYDANRTVLSLPPIINGAHSAISLDTKDIFIECTATDLNKARIVLNTMVTMFACYCEEPFTVEPVDVTDSTGTKETYPDLSRRKVIPQYLYTCRLYRLQQHVTYLRELREGVICHITTARRPTELRS